MGSLAKKIDVMWAHVFDKPESLTHLWQDDSKDNRGNEKEVDFNAGEHA